MVRVAWRGVATLALAALGASFLSGTGQPVTAVTYPRWQRLAPLPVTVGSDALGVRVGHLVLVLGGAGPSGSRAGASYDVQTGRWHRLHLPVPVTDRDRAAVAAGVVVLQHRRGGRPATWWRYDVRRARWTRLRRLPRHLTAPTSFASEVYGLSGRRVEVYSVELGRWTPLPRDPLRPVMVGARVSVTRAGTVVTGTAGPRSRRVADHWDGLRWRRTRAVPAVAPSPAPGLPAGLRAGEVCEVDVGGRLLVVSGGRAWIHTP